MLPHFLGTHLRATSSIVHLFDILVGLVRRPVPDDRISVLRRGVWLADDAWLDRRPALSCPCPEENRACCITRTHLKSHSLLYRLEQKQASGVTQADSSP